MTQGLHGLYPAITRLGPPASIAIELFELLNGRLDQTLDSRALIRPYRRRVQNYVPIDHARVMEIVDDALRQSDDVELFTKIIVGQHRTGLELLRDARGVLPWPVKVDA